MEEIISFIRKNNLRDLRDIILYKVNQHSISKDNVNIEIDFYEDGGLRYIKLSSNNDKSIFRNHTEYATFLFDKEVFESKGRHLLWKYVAQNGIKNIQDFIEKYSRNRKINLFLAKKLEFMIQLSFRKDFSISEVLFLNDIGRRYTKLSSKEFYSAINDFQINE